MATSIRQSGASAGIGGPSYGGSRGSTSYAPKPVSQPSSYGFGGSMGGVSSVQPASYPGVSSYSSSSGSPTTFGGANAMAPFQALAQPAAPAISYNPAPMNISAQENPQLRALAGDYAKYRGELAGNSDLESQQALQRQRDLVSGMSKEYQGEAASRGILNSGAAQQDMLKKIVEPGQQQMSQMGASMAADARQKQLNALGAQSGVEAQNAQLTQAQQRFGLDTWNSQQQAQQSAAQLAALQRNQSLDSNMKVASLLASLYS